ncbi:LamG domain-containing protein [Streptomyces sp. NPDC053755]|uniref:LamG domain-containing protein n=1 Tax=Streptomyces sp. NPDC053755 TaxID=3155815 RepID=UPI00343178D0
MANPDGTFTLTQATAPQRARGADGVWRSVDATLERRADGSIGPKASVVDLRFSGGGSGSGMIRLGSEQGSVSLDWPAALPEPALSGDTATYPEVFAGVDLQLTATAEGYREVLVVKSAEAAANPQLAQIKLKVHSDGLRVVPGAGGGMRAVDANGNAVFKGPAGQMWDSAGTPVAGPQTQLGGMSAGIERMAPSEGIPADGEPVVDEADAPSKGDASEILPVLVEDGTVAVKPDLDLLRGEKTVYPVFIDPPLGLGYSERTVLSSDGDKFWQFTGEYGVGHCASADGYYCGNGYTNRMYYEFAPTKLAGKKILDATFRAYETWSFNCNPWTVDLVRTDNISEATRWPGPAQLDWMGDRYVSYGRGDLCSPAQPDSWVEFNDNPAETDENLTPTVQSFADGKFSRLTLMLRANNESDTRAWKRFNQNAELQIQYVTKPGVPTNVGVIPGDGTTPYCDPETRPTVVTRADPIVQAMVQTQVAPAAGEYQGALRAYMTVEKKTSATQWSASWSATSPSTGYHVDNTLEKVRMSSREDGSLYRMRALTQSHWTYAGVTSSASSAYSPWCYFKMDTTSPSAPQISLVQPGNPYTCTASDTCSPTGGPGIPGSFRFAPNAKDTDIVGYLWYLQEAKNVQEEDANPDTKDTVQEVMPPTGGTFTLVVQARDVRNRYGPPAEYAFKVKLPAGTTGAWRFSEGAGASAANSAAEGMKQPVTMFSPDGSAATWALEQGRGGGADHSLRLNEGISDPAKRVGYATTPMPVNTAESFTVSSWVMLTDASTTRTVLASPGAYGAGFTIYYSSGDKKWVLNRSNHDGATGVVAIRSVADRSSPPLNVWTHLAGVFDAGCTAAPCPGGLPVEADDTLQLFVNGRPQGAPVNLKTASATYQPWTVSGDMQIGRSKVSGNYTGYFMGRIDEIAVWQRPLTETSMRDEAALEQDEVPAVALVADWDASTAAAGASQITDSSAYPTGAATLLGTTVGDDHSVALNGTSAYLKATGPFVDETGSFTITTEVTLDPAKLADKPDGHRAYVLGQAAPGGRHSSWAIWAEKMAADTYVWRFGRTALDANGNVTEQTVVTDNEIAVPGTPVQLTGVFDAAAVADDGTHGALRLYRSANPITPDAATPPTFTAASQGTGSLQAGQGPLSGQSIEDNGFGGSVTRIRIWTGAMTANQVSENAGGTEPDA